MRELTVLDGSRLFWKCVHSFFTSLFTSFFTFTFHITDLSKIRIIVFRIHPEFIVRYPPRWDLHLRADARFKPRIPEHNPPGLCSEAPTLHLKRVGLLASDWRFGWRGQFHSAFTSSDGKAQSCPRDGSGLRVQFCPLRVQQRHGSCR